MDHAAYIKKTQTMTADSLRFVIKDASEALQACPDSPKASDYADEICYCGMELKKRMENSNG